MSFHNHRSTRLIAALLVSAITWLVPHSTPAQAPAPSAKSRAVTPGEPVYYHNGDTRVDLVLALDELQVKQGGAANALRAVSPAVASVEAGTGPGSPSLVRLVAPQTRAALEAEASRIASAAPGSSVQAVLYAPASVDRRPAQRITVDRRLSVKLRPGQDLQTLLKNTGLRLVGPVDFLPGAYIVEATGDGLLAGVETANRLHESGSVEFATPLVARQQTRKAIPNDPLFGQQWHLRNTGSNPNASGLVAGNDVNTTPAWDLVLGQGINIAITDDGLQVAHPDLSANARTDIDIDINYNDLDPTPDIAGDDHGTACAGVAAARGNNGVGVSGAAPQAGLVGVRLISAASTDAQEAQAMLHQATAAAVADRVSINSNSWGPADDGFTLEGPGPLAKAALLNGVTNGRGGRGTIYTWAAGNGGTGDNANYDGYANSRYTIAVAASGGAGEQSSYSESGSCVLVNAPSSYAGGGITTVDRTGSAGYETPAGDYTYDFGGTSSACPLAAGCIALVLQANPNLGWRDVQQLLIDTATKNSPSDAGWFNNAAGRHFNHKFGFGRINAAAAVAAAPGWTMLNPELTPLNASATPNAAIPDNNATGVSSTVAVSGQAGFRTETVEVTVNVTHTYRGDLEFFLTSPSGTVSQLATTRGDSGDNYSNWTFLTVASWGENPNGNWTLKVADRFAQDTGTLTSWSIRVNGTSAAPSAAQPGWEMLE